MLTIEMIEEGVNALQNLSYAVELAEVLEHPIGDLFSSDELYTVMYDNGEYAAFNSGRAFNFGVVVFRTLFEDVKIQRVDPDEICDPEVLKNILSGEFALIIEEYQCIHVVREVELQSGIEIDDIEVSLRDMKREKLYQVAIGVLDTMIDGKVIVKIKNEIEADFIIKSFSSLGYMFLSREDDYYTFVFTFDYLVSYSMMNEGFLYTSRDLMKLRKDIYE